MLSKETPWGFVVEENLNWYCVGARVGPIDKLFNPQQILMLLFIVCIYLSTLVPSEILKL